MTKRPFHQVKGKNLVDVGDKEQGPAQMLSTDVKVQGLKGLSRDLKEQKHCKGENCQVPKLRSEARLVKTG